MVDNIDTPTARGQNGNGQTGGVPLAFTSEKTRATEAGGRPGWVGPKPESSTTGEPFDKGCKADGDSKSLSGSAASFEPSCSKPTPISMLNRGSTDDLDVQYPVIVCSSSVAKRAANPQAGAIGSGSRQESPQVKTAFTTDLGPHSRFRGGHYIKLENINASEFDEMMDTLLYEYQWDSNLHTSYTTGPNDARKRAAYLCFDDLNDAASAIADLETFPPAQAWITGYIGQNEYAQQVGVNCTTSFYDGQVIFVAVFKGSLAEIDTSGVPDAIMGFAKEHGNVLAFREIASGSTSLEYRVEYTHISHARELPSLVTQVQPHTFRDWTIHTRPVEMIVTCRNVQNTPSKTGPADQKIFQSPTGRTAWSRGEDGVIRIEQATKMVPKFSNDGMSYTPATARGRYYSAPIQQTPGPFDHVTSAPRSYSYTPGDVVVSSGNEPQCVNIERIKNGQDVRTTIMLRNIPNRWSCDDLKAVLDRICPGLFDFSYLRIDFQFNTNVGYAFVNFTDPDHVVRFVEFYVGKEWAPGTLPRKIAAVSYATVQGYDCLVEKFRNSSIMDEYPGFRPKLWYTAETAPEENKIGTEKDFPDPNNFSKKQRSHDNAGAIGLWAPKSNQRRQAGRHGQWDRGTTRQLEEEAAIYGSPMHNGMAFGYGAVGAPLFTNPFYDYHMTPRFEAPFTPYQPHYIHHPGYPPPGQTVNPASFLRTTSNGRLGARPFTGPDTAYMGGAVQDPRTPRSFIRDGHAGASGHHMQY